MYLTRTRPIWALCSVTVVLGYVDIEGTKNVKLHQRTKQLLAASYRKQPKIVTIQVVKKGFLESAIRFRDERRNGSCIGDKFGRRREGHWSRIILWRGHFWFYLRWALWVSEFSHGLPKLNKLNNISPELCPENLCLNATRTIAKFCWEFANF